MAILPVPTIPDPEPTEETLERIRQRVMDAIAPAGRPTPAVAARLIRDERLCWGNAVEHFDLPTLRRAEFVRWAVRAGVYSEDCDIAA